MIVWRDYQLEALESVLNDWQEADRLLGVAATGAGKTNILWGTIDRFLQANQNARVLVVAHRAELINQPEKRAREFFPHLVKKIGVVMGDRDEPHRQIIIGTIQTVGGRGTTAQKPGKRLNGILRYGPIDLLIIDEAHHAEASQYYNTFLALQAVNPAVKVLGVTATPERGDKKLLTRIFQKETFNIGIRRLVDEGYLCKPVFKAVQTRIDLKGIKVTGSGANRDFDANALVSAVETSDVFDLVVKTHLTECGDRPTIAFVVSVAGAKRLADLFCNAGVKAKAVYGDMPPTERLDALEGIQSGKYTCLVNVGVLTEGTDLPGVECIHMIRPTKSDALFIQAVGRGLRLSPGKERALILDYAPLPDRSFEQRMKLEELLKVKREKVAVRADGISKPKPTSTGEVEIMIVDYFARQRAAWLIDQEGWRCIYLGRGTDQKTMRPIERGLALSPDGLTLWAIYRYCKDPQTGVMGDRWHTAKIMAEGDAQKNLALIDFYTDKHGSRGILNPTAPWRLKTPPDWLIEKGRKYGLYRDGMTHGALSDAINQMDIKNAVRRAVKASLTLQLSSQDEPINPV